MTDGSITRTGDALAVPVAEVSVDHGKGETTMRDSLEPPFTEYASEHNHPYLVDHFKLGDNWEPFSKEVASIEGYFQEKIKSGSMKNDVAAVKEKLEGIYKLCKIDKTERTTMQIEKLAAYIDFLRKTDHITLRSTT